MKNPIKFMLALLMMGLMSACGDNAPAGEKVEAEAPVETPAETTPAEAAAYAVDLTNSLIEWEGTKPTGDSHSGTIKLSKGELSVKDGNLVGGSFVLDMNSIENTDQEAGKGKEKLEGHLKSGDFFEVEKFPQGTFEIASVEAVEGKEDVSHTITGNLTMKDITKSVTIPVKVEMADGKIMATTPSFTIDRTEWDIKFNSGLIGTLKDKIIDDQIGLTINLVASAN